MSTKTITVHTLTIDHRHGTNTDVFTSGEQAESALRDWVEHYWAEELPPGTPIPQDHQEACETYFDAAGESYSLVEAELIIDPGHWFRDVLDQGKIADLVESKIELLAEYKLEYPQDYEEDDIAAMHAEITSLQDLRERLAT